MAFGLNRGGQPLNIIVQPEPRQKFSFGDIPITAFMNFSKTRKPLTPKKEDISLEGLTQEANDINQLIEYEQNQIGSLSNKFINEAGKYGSVDDYIEKDSEKGNKSILMQLQIAQKNLITLKSAKSDLISRQKAHYDQKAKIGEYGTGQNFATTSYGTLIVPDMTPGSGIKTNYEQQSEYGNVRPIIMEDVNTGLYNIKYQESTSPENYNTDGAFNTFVQNNLKEAASHNNEYKSYFGVDENGKKYFRDFVVNQDGSISNNITNDLLIYATMKDAFSSNKDQVEAVKESLFKNITGGELKDLAQYTLSAVMGGNGADYISRFVSEEIGKEYNEYKNDKTTVDISIQAFANKKGYKLENILTNWKIIEKIQDNKFDKSNNKDALDFQDLMKDVAYEYIRNMEPEFKYTHSDEIIDIISKRKDFVNGEGDDLLKSPTTNLLLYNNPKVIKTLGNPSNQSINVYDANGNFIKKNVVTTAELDVPIDQVKKLNNVWGYKIDTNGVTQDNKLSDFGSDYIYTPSGTYVDISNINDKIRLYSVKNKILLMPKYDHNKQLVKDADGEVILTPVMKVVYAIDEPDIENFLQRQDIYSYDINNTDNNLINLSQSTVNKTKIGKTDKNYDSYKQQIARHQITDNDYFDQDGNISCYEVIENNKVIDVLSPKQYAQWKDATYAVAAKYQNEPKYISTKFNTDDLPSLMDKESFRKSEAYLKLGFAGAGDILSDVDASDINETTLIDDKTQIGSNNLFDIDNTYYFEGYIPINELENFNTEAGPSNLSSELGKFVDRMYSSWNGTNVKNIEDNQSLIESTGSN